MKKTLILLVTLASIGSAISQTPSATSQAYHSYRQQATTPTYGLAKIQAMVKHLKPNMNNNDLGVLPVAKYNALSTPEKFTYALVHPELEDQNCDAMPAIMDEQTKLFAHPLNGFNDQAQWSDRQHAFFKRHRSQVISLLRATIKSHSRVGVNLKLAIVEIDAWELIPDMLTVFKRDRKDLDILSVCMILMKDGNYKPFLASTTYKKLYSDHEANWWSS